MALIVEAARQTGGEIQSDACPASPEEGRDEQAAGKTGRHGRPTPPPQLEPATDQHRRRQASHERQTRVVGDGRHTEGQRALERVSEPSHRWR